MNAHRDADRLLDEALKHELGRASAAPASTSCLDAETVAAWMDGGLDSQAIAMAEAHASNCARCQALLATLARTTPAVVATEPQGARLWRWWFAPLAASAAAATLWMVVPRDPAPAPASAPATEMARAEPGAPRTEPAPGTEPAPAAEPAPANARTADAPRAPAAPTAVPPPPPAAARERANAAVPAPAELGKLTAGKRDALAVAESARKAEAPARADSAAEARDAAAAPPAVAQLRMQRPAVEVVSPDTARRWRAGDRGAVEYSADAGRTWEPVSPAIGATITSGSSPSPTVCWLVGQGGLVMVSIDGRFTRTPFPEATDLAAVIATDARTATVTAVDGRVFVTTDAGQSWRRQ